MRVKTILAIAALGMTSCGYDFDPIEDNAFACAENSDCLDGYVCAGHALVNNKPQSYCVETADSTFAVALRMNEAVSCETGRKGSTGKPDFTAWMRVGTDPSSPKLSATAPPPNSDDDPSECVGRTDGSGRTQLLCTLPLEELADAQWAAVWLELKSYPSTGEIDPWASTHVLLEIDQWREDKTLSTWHQDCETAANFNQSYCDEPKICSPCTMASGSTPTSCPRGFICETSGSACVAVDQ